MKRLPVIFLILLAMGTYAQTNDLSIGAFTNDAAPHADFGYWLPYQQGRSFLLVQAYKAKLFSHKGEFALDFKMKKGTKVCAARGGVVVEVKEDSRKGGLKPKYLPKGNHVIIRHDDGTYGHYWHLKRNGALVNVGDTVQQGQVIALSGNTGYSAFPHLHFEVTTELTPGEHQIPTQFETRKGKRYLKPLHWYRCIH